MKILYLLLFSTLAISVNAQTTRIVTNTLDDGLTTTPGTLRTTIFTANPYDTIRFDPSLISGGSATLTFNGEIAFSKALVIKGLYNSTDTLYFSGNNTNRHFNITNFAGNVTLDSVVLINGRVSTGNGGAVLSININTLFVNNAVIRGNKTNETGGGIYTNSTANIEHSTINGNTGGGIYANGTLLTVRNSNISGNTTSNDGFPGGGDGGIHSSVYSFPSTVTIENCTISGNAGGGINSSVNNNFPLTFTVVNSTISGNIPSISPFGPRNCGGIYTYSSSSSLVTIKNSTLNGNIGETVLCGASVLSIVIENSTISDNTRSNSNAENTGVTSMGTTSSSIIVKNSTISGNTSPNSSGPAGNTGIFSYSPSSTIDIISSIIWSNAANNISNNGSAIISRGNNIFSDAPTGFDASDSVNVTISSLNLLPLASNGGTTQTMLPGAGSIAIDAGNSADLTDAQNISISGRRDIGAAERFSVTKTETKSACSSYSWRDAVAYTADTLGAKFTLYSNVIAIPDTLFTLD